MNRIRELRRRHPDLPGYGTLTEPKDDETDEEREERERAKDRRDALAERDKD